ncbi:MAG: hypothetical protein IKG18_01270 [Atopobiaceae bacterium]|nr:hypothetical protein [Atopobiaceae bacterium]
MALIQVNYFSNALARTVPVNVVLPADKVDSKTHRYASFVEPFKTLYLLHGMFGNYTDWVTNTRVQRWAEERNLAVVMPSGDNMYYVESLLPFNDYGAFVGEELPRIMRAMFPLSQKREDTFIAGLSMGGFGALRNGFKYSDTFSRIAALSSVLTVLDPSVPPIAGDKAVFGDLDAATQTDKDFLVAYSQLRARVMTGKATMPAIYLACGTEDGFLESTRVFRAQLVGDGVDVTYDEQPGGHEWDFWDAQIKKVIDWLPLDDADQGFGSGAID